MHFHKLHLVGMFANLAAAAVPANVTGIQGFNSGAFKVDDSPKTQSDFEAEMKTAQKLFNSPGLFNSVRLYSNIQWKTKDTPISAFDAALTTNTKLLLGIWCSETKTIQNELNALKTYLDAKGKAFADLVIGISVGSEDLYRISESGIQNKANPGADATTIIDFIKDTRDFIKDTLLKDKPVGHVDAWSAWANTSNSAVLDEVDFVGADLYPYYEKDKGNNFSNVTNVYNYIFGQVSNAAKNASKPVWITETGHPVSGPNFGDAVASVDNAAAYWRDIGCNLFGRTNVWWYNLRDSNPDNKEKFAITDNLSTTPKFNLSCPVEKGAPASINTEKPSPAAALKLDALTVAISLLITIWLLIL